MIAVLSNVNCDPVIRRVSKVCECIPGEGYGNVLEMLINPNSAVAKQKPENIFILIDLREMLRAQSDYITDIDAFFATVEGCISQGQKYFISDGDYYLGDEISYKGDSISEKSVHYWNSKLYQLCSEHPECYVFPLARLVQQLGENAFYNDKTWVMGSIRYSMEGIKALAHAIKCIDDSSKKPSKKVLLLDLDNTLWGGVAGEEGLNVQIADSKEGKAYKEFQQGILLLQQSGVILAIVSKNNENDAWEVIDQHPHMVLRRKLFSAYRINWKEKAENIREIAQELNLGLDSMVFIDDNIIERQAVSDMLPEVTVPDFPMAPEMLPRFLNKLKDSYFRRLVVTAEDKNKTEQYLARKAIDQELKRSSNFEDFLKKLQIVVTREDAKENIERLVQLVQKTNQFNTTVTRYTEKELLDMLSSDQWEIYFYDVEDRLAKHGLCAIVIVKLGTTPVIENFIMSCRVMGRNIEYGVLESIEKDILEKGYTEVIARYKVGPKNMPVAELYDSAGFQLESTTETGKIYSKKLSRPFASSNKFFGELRCQM